MTNTPNLDLEVLVGEEVVGVDEWNANWGKIDDFAGRAGDYIVETKEVGAWGYSIYKSGRAECWALLTLTATSVTSTLGMNQHIYPSQNFPVTFKSEPLVYISGYIGANAVVSGRSSTTRGGTSPILHSSQTQPTQSKVNIYAIGFVSV